LPDDDDPDRSSLKDRRFAARYQRSEQQHILGNQSAAATSSGVARLGVGGRLTADVPPLTACMLIR
jgi:hypothetical protein